MSAVGVEEAAHQRLHRLDVGADLHRGQSLLEAEQPRLVVLNALGGIDVHAQHALGRVVRNLLDVHAAISRGDHHRGAGGAVEQHRQVQLLGDGAAVLDIDQVDALGAAGGLRGAQAVAQELGRDLARLLGALHHLDAAVHDVLGARLVGEHRALAATASVDLALHHDHRRAELAGGALGRFGRGAGDAAQDGNAGLAEEGFALVLVDLHGGGEAASAAPSVNRGNPVAVRCGGSRWQRMTHVVVPLSNSEPRFLIERSRQARAAGADLVEVRLDLCVQEGGSPSAIIDAIPALALPAIVTLRHVRENGSWAGDEDARLDLYQRADAAGAAWIDRELVFHAARPWRPQRAKLILSYHDFAGPGVALAEKIVAMRSLRADLAKVAVTPRDAADLNAVRQLIDGAAPVAAMAMGEVGLPSRLLAGAWGSALVFARLPGDAGSAPGQPTTDDLLGMCRLRSQSAATAIYGVIGSPIAHSLSPLIHNLAFAHHRLDAVYAPFRVEDAPAFWSACGSWIAGLSITIPHKTALQVAMDDLEPLCDVVGAMNTIYRQDGRLTGANTDADAIRRCGERALGELRGTRVLVLGAGGAGRAAVVALQAAGAQVTLANRTAARAEALAREVGCRAIAWDALASASFDLLVNMTAVGLKAPQDTPWPHPFPPAAAVFDSVYNPLETRLIREAAAAGCRTVRGLDMFIDQACAQFRRWTGLEAPADLMRAACLERLNRVS